MNIAILGYGKMGKMIEQIATENNIKIKAYFDEFQPLKMNEDNKALSKDIDVFIDFSIPSAVLDNIKTVANLSKNIVIGTTGWYDQLTEASKIVDKSNIGLIYGSNFSLGVNVLFKIINYASKNFSRFENYDVHIEEAHHKMKKDAPSGTALVINKIMKKYYDEEKITINSIRTGYIPGSHSVSFDSSIDTIKIEHVARNRLGFAEGAILAAQWIKGKSGFYEFQEVLDNILTEKK